VLVGGTNRVTVNTLGPDLRSPTPFEGFINANDERIIRDECFGKRAQQYAACFLTGSHGAVEYPMIAAELPFLLQAHRSQGGGHGSLTGGEDRAYEQQLDMLPHAPRKQWREGG
jgi:hypothetical protein